VNIVFKNAKSLNILKTTVNIPKTTRKSPFALKIIFLIIVVILLLAAFILF